MTVGALEALRDAIKRAEQHCLGDRPPSLSVIVRRADGKGLSIAARSAGDRPPSRQRHHNDE